MLAADIANRCRSAGSVFAPYNLTGAMCAQVSVTVCLQLKLKLKLKLLISLTTELFRHIAWSKHDDDGTGGKGVANSFSKISECVYININVKIMNALGSSYAITNSISNVFLFLANVRVTL
jgi:hypothetical protein